MIADPFWSTMTRTAGFPSGELTLNAIRQNLAPISVDDYLASEETVRRKHEYVDGMVYAMVGGRFSHNLIASNIVAELHSQLKGKPCRVLNSDSKVLTQNQSITRFYYPDASVVCGENRRSGVFQDKPTVVVEVLSQSTRRIDVGEKLKAYLSIPTLEAYLLVEQDSPAIIAHHRQDDEFDRRIYEGFGAVIELPAIAATLSLAGVYAEVEFIPEIDDEDQ